MEVIQNAFIEASGELAFMAFVEELYKDGKHDVHG
jgi:hypothetical protein